MAKRTILIVDDDAAMRQMLTSLFRDEGYEGVPAGSAEEALAAAAEHEIDAVLTDIKMPGQSGIELLGALRRIRPETPVVLMTAFGSIETAVEGMRAGAYDYVTKPFEPEAVLLTLDRAMERRALEVENRRLRRAVDQTSALGDLIGRSPAMREIFALIRKVSHNRSNVLITGESGTGKEVVARSLHFHGSRPDQPFIPINCTAIPEGLLESELFGHVRGAFTGAHSSKRGLFEEADGGTLFLDEVGDMGPSLQAKLLRVLQDREIRPVGGNKSVKVDVRIIAATNKDLRREIEEGRFREDLYYRLNVIPIHIPPLGERPEDIPALVEAFLRRHGNGEPRAFTQAALDQLCSLPWKGNARELENVIERALALSDSREIDVDDLPDCSASSAVAPHPGDPRDLSALARIRMPLHELENSYIEAVLELTGGNKVKASGILGIDRKTLYRRRLGASRKQG